MNNKEKDKISIIIPVYNVEKYIHQSITSVINQTYKNLEIIIIDDGSIDNSGKICKTFKKIDSRIKFIQKKNEGLSSARNDGLKLATGKYIAFLDSDDAYHPDFIKKMHNALVENKVDCTICNIASYKTEKIMKLKKINKINKSLKIKPGLYENNKALKALLERKINNCVWNKLYKKELWEEISFHDGHVYEDVVATYNIFKKIKAAYVIDENLVMRRIHNKSITHTINENNIKDWYEEHSIVENDLKGKISKKQMNEIYIKKIMVITSLYVRTYINKIDNKNNIKELLKKYFINTIKNIEIKNVGLKNKISYYLCVTTNRIL